MSNEEMNAAREAQAAMDAAVHNNEESVMDPSPEEEPIAVDNTPAEAAPAIQTPEDQGDAAANQDQAPAKSKPRRAPVKGVVQEARALLAKGWEDDQILAALQQMYIYGGRDDKNARSSAQVILHDVKKQDQRDIAD